MVSGTRDSYTIHPIDVVEHVAITQDWDCVRESDNDDEINLAVEGLSQIYPVQILWLSPVKTLSLLSTVHMEPPLARLSEFYNLVNQCNRIIFRGKFEFLTDKKQIEWRSSLEVPNVKLLNPQKIYTLVTSSINTFDSFMPVFTTIAWSNYTVNQVIATYLKKRNRDKHE